MATDEIKLPNDRPIFQHDCKDCRFLASFHDQGWGDIGYSDAYLCYAVHHGNAKSNPDDRVIVQCLGQITAEEEFQKIVVPLHEAAMATDDYSLQVSAKLAKLLLF